MEHLLIDQLESLLSNNLNSKRIAGQLLILTGCLADEDIPEHISRQMAALSRIVLLQDIFDALVAPLNTMVRAPSALRNEKNESENTSSDMAALLAQIEAARRQLSECETVNYAELIAWVMNKARERKLWNSGRTRR